MGEIQKSKLEELKISLFGTTVFSIIALLIFTGNANLLAIVLFNVISVVSFFISIAADRINWKYERYIGRKEGEVIDNTFEEGFARHSHKQMWVVPKNAEYYKRVAPIKFFFTLLSIIALPFILWHGFTQVFESTYKRIFK